VPERIQRHRTRGWRMPEGAIYVGRPTMFGNPAIVERHRGRWAVWAGDVGPMVACVDTQPEARAEAVEFFRLWLASPDGVIDRRDAIGIDAAVEPRLSWAYAVNHEDLRARLPDLRGRDLACWCPLDQPCHADVLLEVANR
jgi:hypothetical protein